MLEGEDRARDFHPHAHTTIMERALHPCLSPSDKSRTTASNRGGNWLAYTSIYARRTVIGTVPKV